MPSNSAQCKFCGRSFASTQSVRAHLKGCANYLTIKQKREKPQGSPKASMSSPKALPETEIYAEIKLSDGTLVYRGPDGMLYFENARERLLYYRDLEVKRNAKDNLRFHDEQTGLQRRQKEETHRKRQETDAEQRIQEEKELRERRRRKIIQDIKHTVIDRHIIWPSVSAETKATAKLAIEKTLSTLQVLELPRSELIELAEGLRAKTYSLYHNPKDSKKPAKKEDCNMGKTELFSGLFQCQVCDSEFELDLATKEELDCDCGGRLEQVDDDDKLD